MHKVWRVLLQAIVLCNLTNDPFNHIARLESHHSVRGNPLLIRMSNYESCELINELRSRFPIFGQIKGKFGEESEVESIPWFYALLLSASLNREPGAICFVLDKTQGTTALAAVFLALSQLQEDAPHLIEQYANTAISKGQLVRVKPSNFVYEYDGLWEDFPDKFKLKVQDREEWRSFPISDVLRLEPTTSKRRKGYVNTNLGMGESESCIDQLFGITTHGNYSIIQNKVMLCMPQEPFARIREQVSLTPSESDRSCRLSEFLPWGTVNLDGEIKVADSTQVIGEPLVAVTRVPQDLRDAAIASPEGTKLILADGVSRITSDLQAFDEITDRQKVVILANPDEIEKMSNLSDRGHPIWYLSSSEVTIGERQPRRRSRVSLVGRTVRLAGIRDEVQVVPVHCEWDKLHGVAESLERVASEINQSEERSETTEAADLLARLYIVLLEYSESCFEIPEGAGVDLKSAWDILIRNQMWMAPDLVNHFKNAFDVLFGLAEDETRGNEKVEALLDTLTESDKQWTIICRSNRSADCLRKHLASQGADTPVQTIQALNSEEEWEGILLLAWSGRRQFSRLRNLAVTKSIRILTYPFEYRWLTGHQRHEHYVRNNYKMKDTARAEILGIDSKMLYAIEPVDQAKPAFDVPKEEHPMLDFERRFNRKQSSRPAKIFSGDELRPANLIEFYGRCYAFLTEWSKLYVLNDLINENRVKGGNLPMAGAIDLSIDDFVLFRASGEKELTRLLAEDELGIEEYQRTRKIAERWKLSLRCIGTSPELVKVRLDYHGLERGLPTIIRWMEDSELISPQKYEDELEIIAKVADDKELLNDLESVKNAISLIRGAHIRAGHQLTKLIVDEIRNHTGHLDDQPVKLDLEFGQAWVVQVESVGLEPQECAVDQVNRLLWEDDLIF